MKLQLPLIVVAFTLSTIGFAKTRLLLTGVQIGASTFRPQDWKTSTSIQFGYSPMIDFEKAAVRAEIGVAWPRDNFDTRFSSINYEVYAMVPVWSFLHAEVGGGFQSWRLEGFTTRPILSAGVALRVAEFVDRVFIGYSRFFLDDTPTDQIRSGIAVNLF